MASRMTEEPRSVHDIGMALEDRADQRRVFVRVVFEIGVLDDHHVAGGLADAAPHRGALALVVRLKQHAHAVLAVELFEDVAGAVFGSIVNDDELLFDGAEIHGEDARDDGADGGLLVVRRHHDGQFHRARTF
jgi:hypothetical protein